MKIKIKKEVEFEVKSLHVSAAVRYYEDATVNGQEDTEGNLIPCKNGQNWEPVIDVNTGVILNWTIGTVADIHYKVCDAGEYTLKDENGEVIAEIEGYVPAIMCPEDEGFGDYIIMNVDANGQIANWQPSFKEWKGTMINPLPSPPKNSI